MTPSRRRALVVRGVCLRRARPVGHERLGGTGHHFEAVEVQGRVAQRQRLAGALVEALRR